MLANGLGQSLERLEPAAGGPAVPFASSAWAVPADLITWSVVLRAPQGSQFYP